MRASPGVLSNSQGHEHAARAHRELCLIIRHGAVGELVKNKSPCCFCAIPRHNEIKEAWKLREYHDCSFIQCLQSTSLPLLEPSCRVSAVLHFSHPSFGSTRQIGVETFVSFPPSHRHSSITTHLSSSCPPLPYHLSLQLTLNFYC